MTNSDSVEACTSCGRGTGSGTRLFSDRRVTRGDDGVAIYLCGDCNERAVSHFGRQPTERDMVQIAARASGFGLGGGGGFGSGGGGPG
ncbi:MAG TPA: hypothetical protein VF365_12160 [Candidatus Limnocylindria bacterium]